MKVLLLCLRSPYPPADGGTIAMYNMARSLKKTGTDVKILTFNTRKHFIDPASLPEEFVSAFDPEMVYLDASVKALPAMLNLVRGDSYNISRFDTPLFHTTLASLLQREQYDVIQMESLFMTPYLTTIRKYSKAPVIYRSHNVEYLIWKRLAATTTQPLKKWYLNFLSERLKKYEAEVLKKIDGLVALTPVDQELYMNLGYTGRISIVPIGLDTESYPQLSLQKEPLSAVHLGSMDWLPNIEGIEWFLEKVFPLLRKKEPRLTVYLAGKKMPPSIFQKAGEGLVVDGAIDDARNYLSRKQIMLVPLLSGGGMRVKIIEGLAMGKTIITTGIGAEGIQYQNGRNMIIADSPEAFCDAMIQCYRDPQFAFKIGREARKLAEETYDNRVIGKKLLEFYRSVPVYFADGKIAANHGAAHL